MNFMWSGCLVFVFFGVVSEAIYRSARSHRDPTMVLGYGLYLPPLIYVGGTVALYFGGFVKLFIIFGLLGKIITSRRRTYTLAELAD